MSKRVVITGVGVVSSIGIGKNHFWKNLIAGKSGISEVDTFDTSNYEVHRGGEVKGFNPKEIISKNQLKNTARASQFAVAGAKQAMKDAGLSVKELSKSKIAVIMGTTMGEGGMIEEVDKHWTSLGEDDIWAITVTKYPCNAISNNVSRILGLKGKNYVIPTACSAGNYSIGFGYDMIREGTIEYALVGGSDPFSRIGFTGFSRLYAMSPDVCRPFDKSRKGMMVGEGTGILMLEGYENAKKRGADIYAEVLGYGLSCDANHMTTPSAESIAKAMEKAIKNSGIKKEKVDYVSAHGTGTPANDKAECEAIKNVFERHSSKLCISSIKSMLGHTMGAASAIEAIACCLAIKEGVIPPTINYETPDPDCNIDCVPNVAQKQMVNIALNNSSAFGGNNACLVLGKNEE